MVWDLSWDGTSTTIDRALCDELVQKYVDSGGLARLLQSCR